MAREGSQGPIPASPISSWLRGPPFPKCFLSPILFRKRRVGNREGSFRVRRKGSGHLTPGEGACARAVHLLEGGAGPRRAQVEGWRSPDVCPQRVLEEVWWEPPWRPDLVTCEVIMHLDPSGP